MVNQLLDLNLLKLPFQLREIFNRTAICLACFRCLSLDGTNHTLGGCAVCKAV